MKEEEGGKGKRENENENKRNTMNCCWMGGHLQKVVKQEELFPNGGEEAEYLCMAEWTANFAGILL